MAFSYSKRDTFNTKQMTKKRKVFNHSKPHFILQPIPLNGTDEYKDENMIVVLSPPHSDEDYREKRARSVPKKQNNPNSLKSKIKMKKPSKHRLKNFIPTTRPSLIPSLSDQTNSKRKSTISQAKLRKKRSFVSHNQGISIDFSTQDNILFDNEVPSTQLQLRTSKSNPSAVSTPLSTPTPTQCVGHNLLKYRYNAKDVVFNEQQLFYKNNKISIPHNKVLEKWSALEVCAWLISIDANKRYFEYIPLMIEKSIGGEEVQSMTFVDVMKLTNYQMNVSDCTHFLVDIKTLIETANMPNSKGSPLHVPKNNNFLSSTAETPRIFDMANTKKTDDAKHESAKMVQAQDDMNVPTMVEDSKLKSNQIIISSGRFWKLFYFPMENMVQYEVDKPVSKWTPYEVSLWIKTCSEGKFESYAQNVLKHGINGDHLLNISRNELKTDLKMLSPNVRRLFFEELRALSSLEKCSFEHKKMQSMNPNDIHRLSIRLAQYEKDALVNVASTLSVDGTISRNESRSRSRSQSPKSTVSDIEVAQKIVNRIHQRAPSVNNVVVADLKRRPSHFYMDKPQQLFDDGHNRNKSALSVSALFNATSANGLSDEEDIDEFTKSFDDKLQNLEEQHYEESNPTNTKRMSLSIELHSEQNKTNNRSFRSNRSSATYSGTKCINEQEEIEIDSWDMSHSFIHNGADVLTPQLDESQDPLFAETFSPVPDLNNRQLSNKTLPSISGYWDEEKSQFKNGVYV